MPDPAANVGFQGQSGSNDDDAKPPRLTHIGHRETATDARDDRAELKGSTDLQQWLVSDPA
jgi:hypothetical protein